MKVLKTALAATAATVLFAGSALAQGKPAEIKVGITTFLSGPASVFGVPAKAAAEMIAEDLNKKGGIGGVPVKLSFVDEGAGGEALVSNYRRMVQDDKVDATFASISSGSCNQLVPVAEDLKVMNFMWDCGAASILETESITTISAPRPTAPPRCWPCCSICSRPSPTSRPSPSSTRTTRGAARAGRSSPPR